MMSFKVKDKFSAQRSDQQTVNIIIPECPHNGAVKEEVIQIFQIGSTERTFLGIDFKAI